ncbi:hypothetical protein FACS1894141_2200 [Spirochaetia bacterium]|nr:hypothetical protein FACS1894141_2200 [Spirochaetia bacterium]
MLYITRKNKRFLFLCVVFILIGVHYGAAQTRSGGSAATNTAVSTGSIPARLQSGINLYGAGKWKEAIAELRIALKETASPNQRGEVLYWAALAELSDRNYDNSMRAMNELERIAPNHPRMIEIPYLRGRVCYYMGRYDEAILVLKIYMDSLGPDSPDTIARRSSALYWIGESLYALGQLDTAQEIYTLIIDQYPQSAKYDAASYRIDLIKEKKIETELLAILKWSHEESLKTMEEYQRRERSYDQAIVAYQKRIADMLSESNLANLETSNAYYRQRLAEANDRITLLEAQLRGANLSVPDYLPSGPLLTAPSQGIAPSPADRSNRLNTLSELSQLRSQAQEIQDEIIRQINESENTATNSGGSK